MSINRGTDKEDVVDIYSGVLLKHNKNEIMPSAATWMVIEMTTLSEVSQRETNVIWYQLYLDFLLNDANELNYKAEIDPQTKKKRKSWISQGEKGERDELELWD